METFVNSAGSGQVYCLGYATLAHLKTDQINSFYLTDYGSSLNSNMLIINCINSILNPKYDNYFWYIHNMGKFDIVYIFKTLVDHNLISNNPGAEGAAFLLTTTYKNNRMLKLVIKKRVRDKNIFKNKYTLKV